MAVAYIILAHRNPEQVARLVGRLSSSEDVVYVHVDRKSNLASFHEAFAKLPRPPVVLRRRVRVYWGSYSHVKATMLGIRAALRSGRRFSHLVLLTGQDYPIRSTAEIQSFFASAKGRSYISWSAGTGREVHDSERPGNAVWIWSGEMWPLSWWHLSLGDRWWHLQPRVRRRIPRGLTPYQGLAYWAITPEAAAYCLRRMHRRPTWRWFFTFVFIPDENLFQMLLLASPLRDTLVNEDLRFMNWDGYHPKTLRMDDLDSMRASGKLFARKFDIDVDAAVLDDLDRGPTSSPPLQAGSTPEEGQVVGVPGGHGGICESGPARPAVGGLVSPSLPPSSLNRAQIAIRGLVNGWSSIGASSRNYGLADDSSMDPRELRRNPAARVEALRQALARRR